MAGPDACGFISTISTYECQGDQSDGIDLPTVATEDFKTFLINQLTADFGGLTSGSGDALLYREPDISFIIDTAGASGAGVDGFEITGPISVELLYDARGSSSPTLSYSFVTDSIKSPTEVFLSGLGPQNTTNANRQIGYALDVDLGAATAGGSLNSEVTLGFQTFGGNGVSNNNEYDAGPAGAINLTAKSDVVIDSTQGGPDFNARLNLASSGGLMQSTSTTVRGGRGGDITLSTDPGTSFDITNNGGTSILLQSTGGGIPISLPPSQGGTGGSGGNITVNGATLTVNQMSAAAGGAAGIAATSTGVGGRNVTVAGEPAGAGGSIILNGIFDVTTAVDGSEGIAAASSGGAGSASGNAGGAGGTVDVGLLAGSQISTAGTGAGALSAQSIGGRGGNAPDVRGLVAFAAPGGRGGDSETLTLNNQGAITTEGDGSYGILGQAVGGGGGAGGEAFGVFYSKGGAGGIGGAGGAITITNTDKIMTGGHSANGIEAHSIGGGGGNGAFAATVVGGAIGGGGGGSGHGGKVTINQTGVLETGKGADPDALSAAGTDATCPKGCSSGIIAQSIGGGGGNGGGSGAWFSVGGGGGSGVTGGEVDVNLGTETATSSVTTHLDDSDGVMAQSIGGGGGNGGNAVAAGLGVSVAVGGTAGNGGRGGTIDVEKTRSAITTKGDRSNGITAQSIGGGGGTGGFAASVSLSAGVGAAVGVGGSGGAGGLGDTVTVFASDGGNSVTTSGDDSTGVLAQSIGGGGGSGGFSIAADATLSPPDGAGAAIASSVGGKGGAGGTSSSVTVTSDAVIGTTGDRSSGIVAQSIAGGGGNGGLAIAGAIGIGEGAKAVSVGVGGSGNGGGQSAATRVETSGGISTAGVQSTGIVAQSIGGGGGNGGSAIAGSATIGGQNTSIDVAVGAEGGRGGIGSFVTVTQNAGDISTSGMLSDGILAQSIGGGGGNGGMAAAGSFNLTSSDGKSNALNLALGGGGGAGANADVVVVSADRGTKVSATGDGARGIVAQSIGGGGGNGGTAVTGSLTNSSSAKDFNLTIGGGGGTGSAGGNVSVTSAGNITTGTLAATPGSQAAAAQAGGHGILAQSIGGGGGSGGLAVTGSANKGSRTLDVSVGGSGGDGAKGGNVNVANQGAVTTNGYQSDGILAQSISGGGGNALGSVNFSTTNKEAKTINLSVGGKGGGGVTASTAAVALQGDASSVTANGLGSRGVVVQSIGGGGGNGGSNHYNSVKGLKSADQVRVGIGGKAGGGSFGGTATFNMSGGSVTTGTGVAAPETAGSHFEGHGILVQSIGGGGGTGGSGIQGGTQTASSKGELTLGIGGSGSGKSGGGFVLLGWDGDTPQDGSANPITGSVTTTNYNSNGIVAQSIGGGGGTGGIGIDGDVKNTTQYGLNVGIGGSGGAGGDGNTVFLFSDADVTVKGAGSKGLVGQSIGGGGGSGGKGIQGNVTSASEEEGSKQIDFGLGNSGGGGGFGQYVGITNSGMISTGDAATAGASAQAMDAIFAQSIGGGGGTGGAAIVGDLASSGKSSNMELNLGVSLDSKNGGGGGEVEVFNHGALAARGDAARGIVAQSVGGGGGDGQVGIDGTISASADEDATSDKQLSIGIGGKGGGGGSAGRARVQNYGTVVVETLSDGQQVSGTTGILVQSIGGGGGNGGIGVTNSDTSKATVSGAKNAKVATIAVGGAGGTGGNAATGDVTQFQDAGVAVLNTSSIAVTGDAGRGIHAQALGGGGGNAALGLEGKVSSGDGKAISFALGLSGGSGGAGGSVHVNNSGLVTTGEAAGTETGTLADAHGIFAQSIGGGGGTGVVTGSLTYGKTGDGTDRGVDFALGARNAGTKNAGGNADEVLAINSGVVETFYQGSHGIFTQSVGGGGGHAGNLGGIGTEDSSETWAASIAVGADSTGGNGSAAGNGSTVNVLLVEDASNGLATKVTTHATGAHGIYAQSIGGGGGDAGNAAVSNTANAKVGVTLGAVGAATGNGGQIIVAGDTQAETAAVGTIKTSGGYASGIVAQSVGGGGGSGGLGLSAAEGSVVSLGGRQGGAGNANAVQVNFGGDITTDGYAGHGIFAQSIGGGGGYGGRLFLNGTGKYGSGLDMGADDTTAGNGGSVGVTLDGATVTTSAQSAMGVFAQSVGGGGGVQGEASGPVTGTSIGSAGGKGRAGDNTNVFVFDSTITTSAAYAHGVFAQSASGSSKTSGGSDEPLAFQTIIGCEARSGCTSSVDAKGDGAVGVFAQVSGYVGDISQIFVRVDDGASVTGGGGSATETGGSNTAIWVRDGASDNIIQNAGTIANRDGANGIAVKYSGAGGVTVTNTGLIKGNFSGNVTETAGLSALRDTAPATQVINKAGGVLETSGLSTFDLLTNYGRIEVEDGDGLAFKDFQGDVVNKAGSRLDLDLGLLESDLFGSSVGNIGFEMGSTLFLSLSDDFRFVRGATFDLLAGVDLWFEGEENENFSLMDFVSADFFNDDWEIEIFDSSSFPTPPSLFDSRAANANAFGTASYEVLKATYTGATAPIPLPGGAWLYGSLVAVGAGVAWRTRGRDKRA